MLKTWNGISQSIAINNYWKRDCQAPNCLSRTWISEDKFTWRDHPNCHSKYTSSFDKRMLTKYVGKWPNQENTVHAYGWHVNRLPGNKCFACRSAALLAWCGKMDWHLGFLRRIRFWGKILGMVIGARWWVEILGGDHLQVKEGQSRMRGRVCIR